MRFDLIKEVVEYVEQKDLNSRFYITTNGLLLNEEVADFISRHKFTVTFSLDGFKENHDRNRVTTGGKPTFDIVVSKIKMLQKIKRDRKIVQPISFNCCIIRSANSLQVPLPLLTVTSHLLQSLLESFFLFPAYAMPFLFCHQLSYLLSLYT